MKLSGTLRYVDLGPGQWVLETSKGKFALFGEIGDDMANREVVVQGEKVDAMSAGMAAENAVMVQSIKAS